MSDAQLAQLIEVLNTNAQNIINAVNNASQTQQTNIGLWATAVIGEIIGFIVARGIGDPWRK